ncbi:MAG: IS200/IS605 family transposase [Candidatus Thermoplasmatota archaeon]|nr:IS200/IS605 family transposase [Candidatus Thermoplasmatota archaeon]
MFQRPDIRKELENILLEIAERHGFQIYEMSIEEDHVHIFLSHHPSQSIAEIIQYLKGASSRKLRKVFPEFYMNLKKFIRFLECYSR